MRVGLIGTGAVGRRAGRELVARAEVSELVVVGRSSRAVGRLAESLGPKALGRTVEQIDADSLAATGIGVAVVCTPDELQPDHVRAALGARAHVVSVADSSASVDAVLGADDYAREIGRTVVVGAAMSPGWTTLLAAHAAELFDGIDEIAAAVTGVAGPACHERRSQAVRTDTQEWRDGDWAECAARSAPELVWFPEPVGAVDCARGDTADGMLLHRRWPDVPQLVVKLGTTDGRPLPRGVRRWRRSPEPREPGAVRVAVSGRIDGQPATVVYGLSATPAAATGVLVALAAGSLAAGELAPGALPVGEALDPVLVLRAAAERGVRALVYDGGD